MPSSTTSAVLREVIECDFIDLRDDIAQYETLGAKGAERKTGPTSGNGFDTTAGEQAASWGDCVGNILSGAEYHRSELTLANKLILGGLDAGATVNLLRALMEQTPPEQQGASLRWASRYADVTRTVEDAQKFQQKQQPQPAGSLPNSRMGSARDLRNRRFVPIMFFIPGYVAAGCTILAGRPKIGKSWMVLDGRLAVARGGHCLGDIKCEQGDVLYLALEDNERRLQSRITKMIGDADEWPANFHYATEWPRAEQGGLDKIREWIASVSKPRLVIVDVLAMFRSPRRKDQQPYEADYAAISGLQQIASQTGVAIIIVHHLRKSVGENDPFEKVSGTLGLVGAADTVLVLDKDASGVTLYGRGRDVEEIETAMELNKATGRWKILGSAEEVHRSDERSKILTFLSGEKEPIKTDDIAIQTEMPKKNVAQLLFKMVRAGEVKKAGRGVYMRALLRPPNKMDKKIKSEGEILDFNDAPRQDWDDFG
jgi:hypothetical protein